MNLETRQLRYQQLIEQALDAALPLPTEDWPQNGPPRQLTQAMRYSLLAGGKRLRPMLLLAAAEGLSGAVQQAMPFAVALEMIHTYSLIHDDLPAMDNDDLRRGKPTSHKVFGEALAILAGDALLNQAFEIMAASQHPRALSAMREIACRAGASGMIAGQCADIIMQGRPADADMLAYMHQRKTGDLFAAAVLAGLRLAGATSAQLDLGRQYAKHLGLAFQIVDDILDVVGEEAQMGKAPGKDVQAGKQTWTAVYGLEAARAKARELVEGAVDIAGRLFPHDAFLQQLANSTLQRVK